MAVRKHNFLRTSPAEAHNALIRMPAEMKRDGAGVKNVRGAAGQAQMPWNLLSLKYTREYKRTNTCTNKAASEQAAHELQTEFILPVSRSDLVSETEPCPF